MFFSSEITKRVRVRMFV